MWHSPSFGFLSNRLLAWILPVVFCRQPDSWAFNLVVSVISPRRELSNERTDGFGRDLPTVLNKDGHCRGLHSECWSICGGGWQGWQHSPKDKFPLPINGQNSIYTCRECGVSLPQIALTVFTPCLIILTFPRGLHLLPLSVMAWWLESVRGLFWGVGCDQEGEGILCPRFAN